jgi:hypothetical protein
MSFWMEALSICDAPMIHTNNEHEENLVVDLIDDPVFSNPNPPGIFLGLQLEAPWRPRIIAELKDAPVYPFPDVFGQPLHLPGSVRHDLNAISH